MAVTSHGAESINCTKPHSANNKGLILVFPVGLLRLTLVQVRTVTAGPDNFILPSSQVRNLSSKSSWTTGFELNIQIQIQPTAVILIWFWDWFLLWKKIKDAKYFSEQGLGKDSDAILILRT